MSKFVPLDHTLYLISTSTCACLCLQKGDREIKVCKYQIQIRRTSKVWIIQMHAHVADGAKCIVT